MRTIDANLNRIGEGLRLLEDVARFKLNDRELSERLKKMRHELAADDITLKAKLLSQRDPGSDVGASIELPDELKRADLASIIIANSRRVEESLRVVEELSKLPEVELDSSRFKEARFALYEIEKTLVGRLIRHDKSTRIRGLYVIIDPQAIKGHDEGEVASQAIRGGAGVIQLRDKSHTRGEILQIAKMLKGVCDEQGALFIVNDYPDIALASDADGVHLGQSDMPVPEARRILPIDKIIGYSTATLGEALGAEADGADYIAIGSIYPTTSKEGARPAGLGTLLQVRNRVSLPIVAIGGIDEGNVHEVVRAGADSVAVISAISRGDVEGTVRRLVERIDEETERTARSYR